MNYFAADKLRMRNRTFALERRKIIYRKRYMEKEYKIKSLVIYSIQNAL